MSMTQSSSNHGLRSESSSDFIVLTPPGAGGSSTDLDMMNQGFGFSLNMASLQSSHLSLEEALRRVMELMKENQELKETLHKSNTSMKQACLTLTQWKDSHEAEKEEMERERQRFNERRETARSAVESLQKAILERDEHIKTLRMQSNQLASGERCTLSMKEEVAQIQASAKKGAADLQETQKKCEELTQQLKEAKAKNEEITQEMAMMQDSEKDFKLAVEATTDEKKALEDKFASMNESLQKLRETLDTVIMEKRDLVALNNDLTSQIHLKSTAEGHTSTQRIVEGAEDMIIVDKPGEQTLEELIQQAARDDPSLGESHFDLSRPDVVSADSQDVGARRPRQNQQSMSDLLIQLKEERTKVTELMAKLTETNGKVEELQKDIRDKDMSIYEMKGNLDAQKHTMQIELQKQQDQRQKTPTEDIQNYRAQVYSLCEELKAAQQNTDALAENRRVVEERCQQLEGKCSMYQEEIEKQRAKDDQLIEALRVTITSLEAAIHSDQAKLAQKCAANDDLKKKFDSLVSDYHELLHCNEELQSNQGPKGNLSAQEKKRYDERIDHLTAQIVCSEEALKKRDGKIRELLRDNDDLSEQVPVLNAQADVFRDDFEAERSARESLAHEKENLKEEIRQLQLRNQQLQDEVQNLSSYQWGAMRGQQQGGFAGFGGHSPDPRYGHHQAGAFSPQETRTAAINPRFDPYSLDQCDEPPQAGGTGGQSPHTPMTPQRLNSNVQEDHPYECPKCAIKVESMDALQLHVMDCVR